MVFRPFPLVPHTNPRPRPILSRSHFLDKVILVRFERRSHGLNANSLATQVYIQLLINKFETHTKMSVNQCGYTKIKICFSLHIEVVINMNAS